MRDVARSYTVAAGWSSNLGLFFHCHPLNSVHALHLHLVDLDHTGPTFLHFKHKNLPLHEVMRVIWEELQQRHPDRARELQHLLNESATDAATTGAASSSFDDAASSSPAAASAAAAPNASSSAGPSSRALAFARAQKASATANNNNSDDDDDDDNDDDVHEKGESDVSTLAAARSLTHAATRLAGAGEVCPGVVSVRRAGVALRGYFSLNQRVSACAFLCVLVMSVLFHPG